MKRYIRKAYAVALATAMTFTAIGYTDSYNAKAEKFIYDDSNSSLTTAFDRYIATGTGELAKQLQVVVSDELSSQATATDAIIDAGNEGTITEVDLETTGTITEVTDGSQLIDETSEEASAPANQGTLQAQTKTDNKKEESKTDSKKEEKQQTTTQAPVEYEETTEAPKSESTSYAEYAGKAIIIASGVVNIRKEATASSDKVGTIRTGGVVTVQSKGSDWSVISSGSVTGYIKNEFMAFDDAAGKYAAAHSNLVAYDSAQAYSAPAPTTEVAKSEETSAPAETEEEEVNPNIITTATAGYQEVCDYALQFVGNPYKYGGSSLTEGTDCSGFTMSVYADCGYSLPHSSALQATRGSEVALSAVSPGDLIFYKNGGTTIGHVALYIGNGQVVHASTSKTGIIVSNMYYSTPCKAVRIVN